MFGDNFRGGGGGGGGGGKISCDAGIPAAIYSLIYSVVCRDPATVGKRST